MSRDKQLTIEVKDGELHISVGVELLSYATYGKINDRCEVGDKNYMIVKDHDKFAQSIIESLSVEEEDGTTPVHKMFDNAVDYSIGQGEITGVDYPNDPEWDGCVDE